MRTTLLLALPILALQLPVLQILASPILAGPALAQDQPRAQDDRLLRAPYVTGTGSTVDKPGEPQGSAPTALDRGVQRQDNRIDGSICKGC